jgi:hypothetical protein
MRLTSTGLGIGTSSPYAGVDIAKSGTAWASGTYAYPAGNVFIGVSGVSGQNNWIGIRGSYSASSGSANLMLQANYNDVGQGAGNYIASEATGVASSVLTFGRLTGGATTGDNASKVEQMRLNLTGLGIGTSSPQTPLHVYGTNGITVGVASQTWQATAIRAIDEGSAYQGTLAFYTHPSAGSEGSPTEKMRITAAGNLLVGTTSTYQSSKMTVQSTANIGIASVQGTAGGYCFLSKALTNGGVFYHASFEENGTQRGSITSNGTITTYNTTSDYRLKNVIGAVTGHGARIDALEPVEYTWNESGTRTRGFLAHKFQEVYTTSVTGEKDAIDENGKPVYQTMQASTSEVIADLVAEIQSLRQRLSAANL